jgi:hypothetical protein
MKKFFVALLAIAGWATAAVAQVQYPQMLPPSTVWGRLGINAGPGQAVPFSLLGANLFISQPAHGVILGEGGGNPIGSVAHSAAHNLLVSNGVSAGPSYQPGFNGWPTTVGVPTIATGELYYDNTGA